MKSLATLVVLGLLAGSASAAEISRSTLAEIGLPGFAKMSQSAAMNVRGKSYHASPNVGFGGISGSSYASSSNSNSTAHSSNSYGYSVFGTHSISVAGNNASYATTSVSIGNFTISSGAAAGGSSALVISH
jgi:hypothetical protein